MPPLTKTVKLGEWLERLTRLQVTWPSFMPCSSLLQSRSCLLYSTSFSALYGLSWFLLLIPIFLCGFARMNRSWEQRTKREASDERQQSVIFNFYSDSQWQGPQHFSISPPQDGTYPSHQDHPPAAFTNKSAFCRHIWHLRIRIPQAFAFDESQPKQPTDSSATSLILSYQRWIGWSHQYLCFIEGTTIRLQSVSPGW